LQKIVSKNPCIVSPVDVESVQKDFQAFFKVAIIFLRVHSEQKEGKHLIKYLSKISSGLLQILR
jgi:hypothetical protein